MLFGNSYANTFDKAVEMCWPESRYFLLYTKNGIQLQENEAVMHNSLGYFKKKFV